MPLFVWCSGFLFAYTNQVGRKTFSEYFKQRSVRLLVPYFVFSLIGIVPKVLAAPVLNDTLEFDAIQLIRAFLVPREGVWGHFWFLPMIYLMGLLGYWLDKLCCQNSKVWLITLLIAAILSDLKIDVFAWFAINDILHFFPYYCLGVLTCRFEYANQHRTCIFAYTIVCMTLAICLFGFITNEGTIGVVRDFAVAILMIIAIVCLCRVIDNHVRIRQGSLIAQTYQIFILSWPCQLVAGIILERILHVNWLAFVALVFITGVVMPLIILKIIDFIERRFNTKILSLSVGDRKNMSL